MASTTTSSPIQELEKLLTRAKGIRGRFEPVWYLNMAYYIGEQWIFWNHGRLDRPKLESHRVTLTDNRIIGIVRTELAKLTRQKPAFQVVPTSSEAEDMQATLIGEKILDYLWRHLHVRDRLMEALEWSRTCCAGFWKIYWDPTAGQQVNIVVDGEGKPVMHSETGAPMRPADFEGQIPEELGQKTIATGDVRIEVVSPFEFYPDPIARNLQDCEWCIQESVKSVEYVKQRYGVEVTADTDVSAGPAESRLFPSFQMGGSSGYKGVKVFEYWCKPNSEYPQGCQTVWVKQKVLLEGPNPYRELPYVMFKGVPVPGRFWPTSVTEQLRGPQTELNKIKSQITENAQRLGNPSLLASKQANIQMSGVPGERLDYDDTTQNAIPSYLVPPNLPAYVLQQQERAEQSMQEISGQHEVSNAQVPAGVKAASAINLLQEADDTRLGPAIYELEEALGEAGTRLLKLVAQYWTDERTIMIAGEDHAWDTMMFRGAALRDNTHVEVQAGSAFPKSKAAKQAAIESVLNLYFQYSGDQPMNQRNLGKIMRDLEVGGLDRLFGDISGDESQINRENQQLAQALPLKINSYDNTQAHIDGHEEYQKSATYQALPEQVKLLFETHVAEHRQQLLAQMPPPQPPMQQPGQSGPPPQSSPTTP